MSGPVSTQDTPAVTDDGHAEQTRDIEVTPSRLADVGGLPVRRALPRRTRRTVGAWCFADHMGPVTVGPDDFRGGIQIGPHPHIGLQTVTWLLSGEVLHRDSLGSEQLIRPGQLNLMTAGNGISHSEQTPSAYRGELHGIQLWVAQPESTRHEASAFEHHAALPQTEYGDAIVTVLVGEFGSAQSPARCDTDHVGLDIELHAGQAVLPLRSDCEYAIVVLQGAAQVIDARIAPGELGYLGEGRSELVLNAQEPSRLVLLGGLPFESKILMWWNFVARTQQEIDAARLDWQREGARFGHTRSALARIPAPPTPWP